LYLGQQFKGNVRKTIIILLLYSLILRHRHTAPQVYYVTDILRHSTYYVTCLEGHVTPFWVYICPSSLSGESSFKVSFIFFYIYSYISHQSSWQSRGPSTLVLLQEMPTYDHRGVQSNVHRGSRDRDIPPVTGSTHTVSSGKNNNKNPYDYSGERD
jgi:hypothetical protein